MITEFHLSFEERNANLVSAFQRNEFRDFETTFFQNRGVRGRLWFMSFHRDMTSLEEALALSSYLKNFFMARDVRITRTKLEVDLLEDRAGARTTYWESHIRVEPLLDTELCFNGATYSISREDKAFFTVRTFSTWGVVPEDHLATVRGTEAAISRHTKIHGTRHERVLYDDNLDLEKDWR